MRVPTDLTRRIGRRLRRAATRVQHRLGLPALRVGEVRAASAFRHPIAVSQKSQLIELHRSLFSASATRELEEAERLLEHRFSLLGHELHFGPTVAWSLDPVSGRDWSRDFSPDIRYRGPNRLGDIKLPWELSKHQYFFTLGKAAWLSGEQRFAEEIVHQIADWIDCNPCHRGIHWISALETGTRAVSWIFTYPFFAELCPVTVHSRVLRSIAEHMLFVEQNLSLGEYTNTHLVGEAAALVIGALFLDCRHSERWLRKGLLLLNAEATRQVRPDGVHAEQSVAYHRFFLDQYYLVDAVLTANGLQLSPQTAEVMERMTTFLMDIVFPDGSAPAFGDCDDARGIWCRADCPTDYRGLLALGAARFSRGDFKHVSAGPSEELLWLYGERGLDKFSALVSERPAHTSAAYREGGYFIMRSGWDEGDSSLVFDCGPLGHGPAGHGHADALSFQLHAKDRHFFIDSGTYSYNLDYDWRQAFRSTRAHSTITVDGLDQSVQRDRMSWATMARPQVASWFSTPFFDLADGSHDGYGRLNDPVAHRRVVLFLKPDTWLIYDALECLALHDFEMLFHVNPTCSITPSPGRGAGFLLEAQGERLYFRQFGEAASCEGLRVLEATGDEYCPYFSATYGQKRPGHALADRFNCSGAVEALSGILARDDLHFDVELSGGIFLRWPDPSGEACFYYPTFGNARLERDDMTFDGRLLFHLRGVSQSQTLYAYGCSYLHLRGELQAAVSTTFRTVEIHGNDVLITTSENADNIAVSARAGLRVTINGQPWHPDPLTET